MTDEPYKLHNRQPRAEAERRRDLLIVLQHVDWNTFTTDQLTKIWDCMQEVHRAV